VSTADALEAILGEDGDADEALRRVVGVLVEQGGCVWAGILFMEQGELVLGPEAGEQHPSARLQVPVIYDGAHVADLVVDGCPDKALAERVAVLISAHCLVGWDTGGIPWDDLS
jgi:hypothetical protein